MVYDVSVFGDWLVVVVVVELNPQTSANEFKQVNYYYYIFSLVVGSFLSLFAFTFSFILFQLDFVCLLDVLGVFVVVVVVV